MKNIEIFTDGSSLGNPGAGGWCAILRYKQNEKIFSGNQADATNNQMELKAAIEAIKQLKEPCNITLTSDSSYVTRGINEWLHGWIKKDFKGVKNPQMWKELVEVLKNHKIKAFWVRGHDGHEENERCDKIAQEEAQKIKEKR